MRVESQQLKAFLLDAGLVTQVQFDEAQKKAEKTKQKVGDVLVSESLITQEELIKLVFSFLLFIYQRCTELMKKWVLADLLPGSAMKH